MVVWYEIITTEIPRHFYIDADASRDKIHFGRYTNEEVVEKCYSIVQLAYNIITSSNFEKHSLVVSSVKDTSEKQSVHIKFPIQLQHHEDSRKFGSIVKYLASENDSVIDAYIDGSVYTRNRCFRCLNQSKFGQSDRPLRPFLGSSSTPTDHLIGIYGDTTCYTFVDAKKLEAYYNTCLNKKYKNKTSNPKV